MTKQIVEALNAKYVSEKLGAIANLQNYLSNPVGVAEHPDIISECDKLIEMIGSADDKINTLRSLFSEEAE